MRNLLLLSLLLVFSACNGAQESVPTPFAICATLPTTSNPIGAPVVFENFSLKNNRVIGVIGQEVLSIHESECVFTSRGVL